MLKEGNKYFFTIQRLIEMPPDGELQFVMESDDGLRFLMPEKYYPHYKLQAGQRISCKVDKINCSGRIYLEPEHPYCKPGDLLDFHVTAETEISNSFGELEKMLILCDPWDQTAQVNISGYEEYSGQLLVKCRIDRIKKGLLLVSHPAIKYISNVAPDPDNVFVISGIRTLAENLEYYLLSQGEEMHMLRTKYYSKYGFEKGMEINCRLIDKPMLYGHYLEPRHPYYEPGGEYWFDFIRLQPHGEITEKPHHRLIVQDLLGHEYPLIYEGLEPHWVKRVKARVTAIKMSKLSLELIDLE